MSDDQTPAWRDGWLAHKNDMDTSDNPYNDQTQTYSHAQWESGWCARFGWCKHSEPGETSPFDEVYS